MGYKSCVNHNGWQINQERLKLKWKNYREKKEEEYYKNPKLCKRCNKPIKFSEDIKRRNFCSHSCSAWFNNLGNCRHGTPRTIFYCLECNKKLTRHKKKYCSKECWAEGFKKQNIKKWKEGRNTESNYDSTPSYIRNYIFKKYNNSCSGCGWSKINIYTNKIPLHIHHIDGNYLNNNENNLQLLCPNCHSLTPTNGSLNRGKGRNKRKFYRAVFNAKLKQISAGLG